MKSQPKFGTFILLLLGIILLSQTAAAAAGGLDPTFGTAGKVRVGLGGDFDRGNAVARQTDGKIVVAGQSSIDSSSGTGNFSLVRYNMNGSLDATFGDGGKVETHFLSDISSLPIVGARVSSLAVLSNGKIVVAGDVTDFYQGNSANVILTARFNANGSLDTTFGTGGRVITALIRSIEFKAMTMQTDGKIVVLSNSLTDNLVFLVRYNTNGTLDDAFDGSQNGNGIVSVNLPLDNYSLNALKIQSGKLLIAGRAHTPGDVLLLRFNADGNFDATFTNTGYAGIVVTADAENSGANAIAFFSPTADLNYILVAGSSSGNPAVWRYDAASGALDNSFGVGGRRIIPAANTAAIGIGLQINNGAADRIVIAGNAGSGSNSISVSRLLINGALDTALGSNATVTADIGNANSIAYPPVSALFIQPEDNKIVVAGTTYNTTVSPDSDFSVVRFTANGALDATFDGDGIRRDDVGNLPVGAKSEAIQADGKIVVTDSKYLARFNPNGSLDTSFNGSGKIRLAARITANSVAVQTDGKIVVAGAITQITRNFFSSLFVTRYNTDGSLDTSFGSNGIFIANDTGLTESSGAAVAIQPDGKILAAGYLTISCQGFCRDFLVYRFNPNGSPDVSFDGDGMLTTAVSASSSMANSIAVLPNGKIAVAGYADLSSNNSDFAVAVYNPDGSLDNSFNDDGVAITTIGLTSDDTALAIAVQAGKIVVAGLTRTTNTLEVMAIIRYTSNGLLDPTFDGDGKVTTAIGTSSRINALAIQPDGKILAAGWSNSDNVTFNDFTVVRYNTDGSLDASYGSGGKVITDLSGSIDYAYTIALDSSGRAVVAGDANGLIGLIRLQNNGARSPFDFDGDGKSDVSVFRPSSGAWYVQGSTAGFYGVTFGQNGDKITPADFDGDGKTDIAVFRSGTWYLLRSSLGFTGFNFGLSTDIPMPADYDGDGKADVAVFRPSNGTWYVQGSSVGFYGFAFGQSGDVPVAADYDGDGKADIAVFRPATGVWYLNRSALGFTGIAFGQSGDKPVAADYDGDGKADIAVFRSGTWYLNRSTLGFIGISFGLSADTPAPADYDGDGKADIAVFRSSTGTWYLQQTTAGFTGFAFGVSGDLPTPGAFVL